MLPLLLIVICKSLYLYFALLQLICFIFYSEEINKIKNVILLTVLSSLFGLDSLLRRNNFLKSSEIAEETAHNDKNMTS